MNLVLVIPVYKRHEIARKSLEWWNHAAETFLNNDWDIKIVVVGSEGHISRNVCEEFSDLYLEHTNKPVWEKWNAGIVASRQYTPDYIMCPGDDEVADENFFKAYLEKVKAGYDYIGVTDCYFYNTEDDRGAYWPGYDTGRKGEPHGPFRMVSRKLLDQLGWKLFDDRAGGDSLFVDGSMTARVSEMSNIKPHTLKCIDVGAHPVSMKDSRSVNKIDDYKNVQPMDPRFFLKFYQEIDEEVSHDSNPLL